MNNKRLGKCLTLHHVFSIHGRQPLLLRMTGVITRTTVFASFCSVGTEDLFPFACQGVSLFGEGGGGGMMTITFLSPQHEGKRVKKNNVVGKASSKENNSLSSTASHFSYSTKVLLRVTRQYLRNSTQWFTCCQSYLHHYSNFQMVTSSRKTRSLWSIHTQCTMTRKSGKNQSRSHQVKERSQNIQIWLLWHLFGGKTTTTHNKYIWNN